MNDFKLHVALLRDELQEAIDRVLQSGWFILGKEVESFEREFAAFVGASHAAGVGNGMEAIELALKAFDIGPGQEVITTPNSAFASALAILNVGATPVFVDIDPQTYALDVSRVADVVTPRTRALLPVHIYGRAVDLDPLVEIARRHSLVLINDAAQAHGTRYRGRDVASFGDATAYSFYPTKNLGAFGDGGAVTCADPARAARIRCLRDYGQDARYHHVEEGLNSRLDEVQAAILRVKLRHLPRHNGRRRELAAAYREKLAGLPLTLPAPDDGGAIYHQFVVRTSRRDALATHLRERQIHTLVHYPTIIPLQPALARFGYARGMFPVAERCADEILSLPIFPEMTDAQLERVCAAITEFFA